MTIKWYFRNQHGTLPVYFREFALASLYSLFFICSALVFSSCTALVLKEKNGSCVRICVLQLKAQVVQTQCGSAETETAAGALVEDIDTTVTAMTSRR